MIVRIATEGQYRVSGALLDQLNEIDNRLVDLIANEDEAAFKTALDGMLSLVRQQGEPVPLQELVESHLILPAPNTTLEEARELFRTEGVIPG